MFYIASAKSGLEYFDSFSYDSSDHIYAYYTPLMAMIRFMSVADPNNDFTVAYDETEEGKLQLWEGYKDGFKTVYEGMSCYLYEVKEYTYLEGLTGWKNEYVSAHKITAIHEEKIIDIYQYLLKSVEDDKCELHPFIDTTEYTMQFNAVSERMEERNSKPVFIIEEGKLYKFIPGRHSSRLTIPDGVTSIEYRAFYNSRINSITIPNDVSTIEEDAFYGSGLYQVELPESLKKIGKFAFGGCKWLRDITIPDGVIEIGPWALGYYFSCDYNEPRPNDFTMFVYGKEGSEAERYAQENESYKDKTIIKFIAK
ncbi:MAG: leucine-rich repeat domain-containing protein [Erysipelotrichaceae bacterium]|nr:leucine-rich repeat domain-containing protein [Erysipelotrichaceae bacterium]